ncbi:MAG: ribulose-phosphate 3-epimerase [Candidatus Pacebacteria bacterium]|nr:ribulose-phosphate 3-epimerase [Candidatus Paceibacterota bacterium]
MIEVVPSILVDTKEELEAKIKKLELVAGRVHIDIMDGSFGLRKTGFGHEDVASLNTGLVIDVHLMVIHPQSYLPHWFLPKVDRIFISAEAEGELKDLLIMIKAQGKKAGLVLNPETSIDAVYECLEVVDCIQFMAVHPGTNGGLFLSDVVEKIINFHDLYPDTLISVDGGMNPATSQLVRGVGAQVIVSGSYVSSAEDPAKAMAELKEGGLQ